MATTIYRQSRDFPPAEESYVCQFEKRTRRGLNPYSNALLDKASRGLSVLADVESARIHARENKQLGNFLVRYHIPDTATFTLEHRVGNNPSHLTLTMDPLTDLSDFIDMDWWEAQDFNPEMAG